MRFIGCCTIWGLIMMNDEGYTARQDDIGLSVADVDCIVCWLKLFASDFKQRHDELHARHVSWGWPDPDDTFTRSLQRRADQLNFHVQQLATLREYLAQRGGGLGAGGPQICEQISLDGLLH